MPRARQWKLLPLDPLLNVWLHRFTADDGPNMHDHPWPNVSIILRGAYREITPTDTFDRRAGDVVFRRATARHRVEITEHPCWSLFITGPRIRQWREYPAGLQARTAARQALHDVVRPWLEPARRVEGRDAGRARPFELTRD